MREAHVPTQQPQAQEDARISRPDALARRTRGDQGSPASRSQATDGLIWRVRDRASFAALARARRHRRGLVTLRYLADPAEGPPRVAYAVDRRMGSAVRRNRARRRLRAAVAACAQHLSAGAYLFGVEPEVATMSFEALVSCVRELADVARAER
jgi:ribonuclease P protein component